MKIQLLILIGAAFGLTLPGIPDLPDLVGFVENSVHGNFTVQTVEEPQEFLPTIAKIRAMTDQERSDRLHWFVCVFLAVFLFVTFVGTVIMVGGAKLKTFGSYQALGHTAPLSKWAQLWLFILSFGATVLSSFIACMWSLQTGRLSKTLGLDWEIYLILFCCVGVSLLVQAVVAVTWLKAGDCFDTTAFAIASFVSMAPFISDQFDTLKDVIFGGLCFQSEHLFMQIVGVLSWLYLVAFHGWFLFLSVQPKSIDTPGGNCFNEVASSHLSVLVIAPKVQGEWSGSCWEGIILPTIYKQVTKCKREHLLIENVPQALMSLLFLSVEGGSFFVTALNLVVPGVHIALTYLLFKPVRAAAIPALAKRFNRALHNGNTTAAKALWHEAEIMDDRELLKLFLPHLTVLNETLKHCSFMSGALEDLEGLSDQELDTLQRTVAVFASEVNCAFNDLKIGSSGAKVLAEALKTSGTLELHLDNNDVGDEGAEALGASLKSNGSLQQLFLKANGIGNSGAQALAASLKSHGSLQGLSLEENNISESGAEALAESLTSNDCLQRLVLRANCIGVRGAQAMAQSLRRNRWLQELDLHGCNIGNQGVQALATCLTSCGSLRSLHLGANNIDDRGAKAVAQSLRSNCCLQELYLQRNEICDPGAQDLAESLTRNRTLLLLDLDANIIGDVGAEALVKDCRYLHHLSIVGNIIGDRGPQAMAKYLSFWTTGLTHLRISGTLRGRAGGQALEAAERNRARFVHDFKISWQPVGADMVVPLGERFNKALHNGNTIPAKAMWQKAKIMENIQFLNLFLPHLTVLMEIMKRCGFMSRALEDIEGLSHEELETFRRTAAVFASEVDCNLAGRKIGNPGAKVLAEALQISETTSLNLDDNDIQEDGAKALGTSLKSNGTLQRLFLKGNIIGDSGAEAFADGLKNNRRLQWILLEKNGIGVRGAEALAESLTSNDTLQRLVLRANSIGVRGAQAMARHLQMNRSLQVLDLHGCSIGKKGAQALARGFCSHCSLRSLFLGANSIGDNGAKAVAKISGVRGCLLTLDLNDNSICDSGAEAVAQSLGNNLQSLLDLYLQNNGICDRGAQALAESLRNKSNLQSLYLGTNNIGDHGAQALVLTGLQRLYLEGNNISDQGAEAIRLFLRYGLPHLQVSGLPEERFARWYKQYPPGAATAGVFWS